MSLDIVRDQGDAAGSKRIERGSGNDHVRMPTADHDSQTSGRSTQSRSFQTWVFALTGLLLTLIFLADLSVRLGIATGISYILPVWIASRSHNRKAIILVALLASSLTILGYILSPEDGDIWKAVANRVLSIAAISLMTMVVLEFHHASSSRIVEAERELARLVEQSGDSLISTDLQGIVKSWNEGAERIFGYSAEEMIGGNLDRMFVPGRSDGLSEVLGEIRAGRTIEHFPATRRHKDGHLVDVEITVSPMMNADGRLVGIVGVSRDVTLRNEAQREADRLRANLAATNEALRRSNQDLTQFVSIASHDLRSPMRGIRALVSFIQEDDQNQISEESREYLDALDHRVSRLQSVVDGLLQYGRAGRGKAEITRVDCAELCGAIRELVDVPRGFSISVGPDLPVFETSRAALETVLRNLIVNALRHHDRDKGEIRIEARDAPDEIEFSVIDDGPGIDPMYHSRIFEAFKTLETREDAVSTGLGLAIVQRLVDAAGGKIRVESQEGRRGSCFRFTWRKTWPILQDGSES